MAMEKRLKAVPPQAFTALGTQPGEIIINDTRFFKVKQKVVISATALPNLTLEVKRISDDGETMYVGPEKGNIDARSDLTGYSILTSANIWANEQPRPSVPEQEIERLTYEEEPIVARRVIPVDRYGNTIDQHEDGIVPQEFDDVQLTRDLDGDIIEAEFYYEGSLIRDLELTYDLNKDLIRVRKID